MLPTLEELGIGFVPFSPLGKGFLTGKIDDLGMPRPPGQPNSTARIESDPRSKPVIGKRTASRASAAPAA